MAEAPRTKRPPGRTVQRPFKDPRIDSSPPVLDDEVPLGRAAPQASSPRIPVASRPPSESIAMRVAGLEEELDRLRAERAEEADQIADVLVRIAESERARAVAEQRAAELEERARSLEAQLGEARATAEADASLDIELQAANERCTQLEAELQRTRAHAEEAIGAVRRGEDAATRRAELAEQAAADAANSLNRAHGELAADRSRVVDMEAKLAKLKREHGDALEAERRVHAREMQAITTQRDEERAKVERDGDAAVEKLRAEHAAAMKAAREERTGAAARLLEEHTRAVAKLHDEHAAALENAAAIRARDVDAVRAEVDALRADAEKALAALREEHAKALADQEAKLAEQIATVRKDLAFEKREIARQLEEERSANARLRQQATAAEGSLNAAREAAVKAVQVLEDLERREQTAADARTKAIAELRTALRASSGNAAGSSGGGTTAPRKAPASPAAPAGGAPTVEVVSLDDIEMDLPE